MTETTERRKWVKTRTVWTIFKVVFLALFLYHFFRIVSQTGF